MTTSLAVRDRLVEILRHDLVGPDPGPRESEILPQAPSGWYLTGPPVPYESLEEHQTDPADQEQLDLNEGNAPEVGCDAHGTALPAVYAKCVLVDDERALVTSANFTTAAPRRDLEAGVLLADVAFVRALRGQFDALVAAGVLRTMPGMGA